MNAHISDELPRMLTGEATRDEVMAGAAHLRTCVDCQQELVSALVAHASLTSAHRFAPEVVSGDPASGLAGADQPGTDVPRTGVTAADDPIGAEPARASRPLPDLSAVFAEVRAEAAAEQRPPRGARRGILFAVAAAAVVLGGGAAIYAATTGSDGARDTGRTVQLAAFDKGRTPATATIGAGTITVDAASLPKAANTRYEVWLTNGKRTRMQPIGWIGNDGKATMSVPPEMMQQYGDLEVSVQRAAATDYTYSGTSVLRGSIS